MAQGRGRHGGALVWEGQLEEVVEEVDPSWCWIYSPHIGPFCVAV